MGTDKLNRLFSKMKDIIPQYPVEVILSFLFGLSGSLVTNDIIPDIYLKSILYIGLSVFITYIINIWCIEHKKSKSIYYIGSIIAVITLPVFGFIFRDVYYYLTGYVISVLVYFLAGTDRTNATIVSRAVKLAKSIFVSASFLIVIIALLWLIILSVSYLLFQIDNSDSAYLYSITGSVSFTLLLIYSNRQDCNLSSNIYKVLIHYILTPSLLIYTLIIYLYIAKIVFKWDLPEGNLGYITIMYISLFFMTKAISDQMPKFLFYTFYRYAPVISIIPLILLWISAVVRIYDYGLTIDRCYLVIVAFIETAIIVLSLSKKTERYVVVISIAIVLLFTGAYVPFINVKAISEYSQSLRPAIESSAPVIDSKKTIYIGLDMNIPVAGYTALRMMRNPPFELKNDSLFISFKDEVFTITEKGKRKYKESLRDIYARRLAEIGVDNLTDPSEKLKCDLLCIKHDSYLFMFSGITLYLDKDTLESVSFVSPIMIFSK